MQTITVRTERGSQDVTVQTVYGTPKQGWVNGFAVDYTNTASGRSARVVPVSGDEYKVYETEHGSGVGAVTVATTADAAREVAVAIVKGEWR